MSASARVPARDQESMARLIFANAPSLLRRFGHAVVVFEDRSAVWRGLTSALERAFEHEWPGEKSNLPRVRAYGMAGFLPRTVAAAAGDLLSWLSTHRLEEAYRQALAGGFEPRGDGLDTIRAGLRAIVDGGGGPLLRAQLAALSRLSRWWRFDYGILDDAEVDGLVLGCPDDKRRELHRTYIEAGGFNLGICIRCPSGRDRSCTYWWKTRKARGVVTLHPWAMERVLSASVSALFSGPPNPLLWVSRSRGDAYVSFAAEHLGGRTANVVRSLLVGGRPVLHEIKPCLRDARKLRRIAALSRGNRRRLRLPADRDPEPVARQALEALAALAAEPPDDYAPEQRALGVMLLARGVEGLLAAGAWHSWAGRSLPDNKMIPAPLAVPPLRGLFIAFADNVDAWIEHLAPPGAPEEGVLARASVVGWSELAEWITEPEDASLATADPIGQLLDTASALMTQGRRVTQETVASELGMSARAVESRCRRHGVPFKVVKELARQQLDGGP